MTVTIQIGNTDNKLTQAEWAFYCEHMRRIVEKSLLQIHFSGGASFDSPFQNACWVGEIHEGSIESLWASVTRCRESFDQDWVAVTLGDTFLI